MAPKQRSTSALHTKAPRSLRRKKNGEIKGRVLLMHGDEILLKSPEAEMGEFGYIVNIEFT